MSDIEEDIVLTASEVCLASVQEDDILDDDNFLSCVGKSESKDEKGSNEGEDAVDTYQGENTNGSDLSKPHGEGDKITRSKRMKRRRFVHHDDEYDDGDDEIDNDERDDDEFDDEDDEMEQGVSLSSRTSDLDSPENSISDQICGVETYSKELINQIIGVGDDYSQIIESTSKAHGNKKENLLDAVLVKSKENSESDTRVSATSETSVKSKNSKRKKRKVDLWFKKKRKRNRKDGNKGKECDSDMAGSGSGGGDCGSGNTSPSVKSDSSVKKSKKSSDSTDNPKKARDFAIPSPSLADNNNVKAAIPESTATSDESLKQGLCQCRKKPHIFVSGNRNAGDLYCQGLDSINNKIIGCCNPIPSLDVGLFRASEKTCYQMMCNVHQQRLFRHNCCPGCGLFCTKGRFYMCKSMHHFHKMCSVENEKGLITCPHCGDDTPPKSVIIIMSTAKDPILLPQQKPPRTVKAAKMSITRGVPQILEDDKDPEFSFPSAPYTFSQSQKTNTGGGEQSSEGNMLAHLLSIACRSLPELSSIFNTRRCSYKNLYSALEAGDIHKVLRMFASGLNPNHEFEDHNQRNALHVAAGRGHMTLVHVLLQAQTQINVMDAEQNTPLTLAIVGKHNDIVKYLIKCGADLTMKGEDGMTPLHIAAKCGNIGACYHILNGVNLLPKYIDTPDDGGWTPMVWASEFNHMEVVRFLMSKGADPLVKDTEQNIALHWAAFGGSIDIVELFLNDGADINAVNVHGDTPLHIAARQDKYNCVLLLLARGAKSCIKNKSGEYARDCSESPQCEIYKAISLNMEIHNLLGRFNKRTARILSNDISYGKERNQIQCVNGVDDDPRPNDFMYVTESCFTSKITVDRTITSLQFCKCGDGCSSFNCNCANISIKCWYDNQGRLSPEFNYSDPPMIFECNQACQCNRITCHNRVVQNGISCRFQLFKTETRGWGIKTLNPIQKGTYVCEYVGEIISDCEADHREDDSYLFDLDNKDGETYCIDARRYGNFARFINHMCVPNLMPVHVFVDHQDIRFPRIAFFANRDIAADEELGYNYGEKFWVIKWKSFTCNCGAEKCMYSEKTIKTTLENYNKKIQDETV